MLGALAEAVDRLSLTGDCGELVDALFVLDRLRAKVTIAAGECVSAELYRAEDYASMNAFLRARAGLTERGAREVVGLAKKLRSMKCVADAWLDTTLCGGQVDAIAGIVPKHHRERFVNNEAAFVDSVIGLTTAETVTVAREWVERADAVDERPRPGSDDEHSECFFNALLRGAHDLRGTFAEEDAAIIDKALDEATRDDPTLTAPQRRAQALTDICDYYLNYHGTLTERETANRERPHVNIGIDLDLFRRGEPARYVASDVPTPWGVASRILCDANIHRYLFDAENSLIDYGRSYRSAPLELFQALLARDGGCRGAIYDPHRGVAIPCDRIGEDCQAHHLRWWEHQGETNADNMALLCRQCHRYIHRHRIEMEFEPDGLIRFRTPDGIIWTTRPRSQLPRPPVDLPVWNPYREPKPEYDDDWDEPERLRIPKGFARQAAALTMY